MPSDVRGRAVAPRTDNAAAVPLAPARQRLALVVIGLGQLLIVLDVTIVNIALPTAQQALHISDSDRPWVVTAYTLAFGGLLLLGGRVADFTGRRRAFVAGLLGFAAASALGSIAPSAGWLFAARGLQGVFAALMAPAALSLLSVTFTEPRERARAFSVYGAISAGGGALGLLLGGFLTEYASWRWTLFISAPVALLAAGGARRVLSESRAQGTTRYDIPGAIVSTAGLVMLVYGFSRASSVGWSVTETLAELIGAAALLGVFVLIELRSDHPLLPIRIVLDGNRGGAYLSRLFIGVAIYGVFLFLTYYLQQSLGYSALVTGAAFLPYAGCIAIGAAICARLLPRVGLRYAIVSGLLLASLGMLLLTRIGTASAYGSIVLPAELVVGLGLGVTFGPLGSLALIGVPERDSGVAGAVLNTAQQVGGSLGTALLNTIATSAVAAYAATRATGAPSIVRAAAAVHSYMVVFGVSAAMLGAAALTALVLVRVRRDDLS